MNQIAIYQHPFVDVLQAFKVQEWTSSQKEGDVTETYDKTLAKNVIKIAGTTSASNYIQVPATKHLPKQALGLTGKFVYLILNAPVSKQFVAHFDYVISDARTVRISLSNLYKEFKNMNGSSYQVPLGAGFVPGKWTLVCVNVQSLLETNKAFQVGQPQKFSLRSFSFCSTVLLRGIFTSDIQYTVTSLPKQMSLRIAADKDWFAEYSWISIPDVQIDHTAGQKENKNKSNLKKSSKMVDTKVSFEKAKEREEIPVIEELTEQQKYEIEKEQQQVQMQEQMKQKQESKRQGVERTVKEVEQLKKDYDLQLQSKHIKQQTDVVLYQTEDFYDPNKSQRRNAENYILKPDPIMALDRVLGVHPSHCAQDSFFNQDEKLASELLYTQADSFVGYHHKIAKQRLFLNKEKVSEILKFYVTRGYAITISKQANGKTEITGSMGMDIVMSVWDLDAEVIVIQTKPPLQSVSNISMISDQSALCLSGKDLQGRELILMYAFQELVNQQKVELLARQLGDFQLVSLKFAEGLASTLVGCGKENIRFFKVKNNFMPSQLVSMNNTSRGKTFNNSLVSKAELGKKPSQIYVTTECGQLFIVNYFSRQIEKIVQLHDGAIQTLIGADKFKMTASRSGNIKIWNGDFSRLVSEVSVNQTIRSCDVNIANTEISILASDGTLSILDLETSSFKVVMRSHQADLVEVCHNRLAGAIVSIGADSSIKVWSAESLDQIHEFNTSTNDPPTKLASATHNDTIAVGFKSGFLRLFSLCGEQRQMYHESMIFESAVMDIQFSRSGKFMAAFYKNAKIVIFNIETNNECKAVKNIDYEFPNTQHFSLSFSPDGAYLANLSSNANTVTIWETKNFSLRWYIDLTGEVLSKLMFAPNGRDLLVLTTTSKLKYLRVSATSVEVESVREQYGLTDQETTDFTISQNNKFLLCSGKDGQIKVYDYFMRGKLLAAQQAFTGHFKYANKICLTEDLRYLYSVGQGNGIFRWSFFGDKEMPTDLTVMFEKTKNEIIREEQKENEPVTLPTFKASELKSYTEEQIGKLRSDMIDGRDSFAPKSTLAIPRPHQEILQDGGISLKRQPKVEYTPAGYTFEQHQIELKKILGCSIAPSVGNNIVWNQKTHCIIYSLQNILVFEQLDQEKSQVLKQEFLDPIHAIQLSFDSRLVLAFTRHGKLEGYPQIIVWDAKTQRKVSQVTVQDYQINSVQFSNLANMLLVVSQDEKGNSSLIVWDFLEGRRDFLAKSIVPFSVLDVRWNPYLRTAADEFVSLSKHNYHYWRITPHLQMEYQAGKMPKITEGELTAITFVEPMQEQNSVYMLIGLSSGHVWVLDTRSNSFLHSVKVLDGPVLKVVSSVSRIVIEGNTDTKVHSWELKKTIGDFDYDASDPDYFFAGKSKTVTLDGYPSASHYDGTAAEALFISTNNSIWLANFIEGITVKLKSCHEPNNQLGGIDFKYVSPNEFQPSKKQDQNYIFDQNYLIGSTAQDGVVKVWNMFDLENMVNFIVPKERCTAISMHQFKPFMICSFTDSYLRFFDLDQGKNLGRCQINTCEDDSANQDYVTSIKILPSGNNVLCLTKYGQVFLIFVENWKPLSLIIHNLVSLNISVHAFDVSFLEPYNKWLVSTANGKVFVYNRQDCNSFKQELFDKAQPPTFIFMDSFNVQEYVDNCFTEAKRVNTLDHYYNAAQRTLVYNETNAENEVEACFLNNDLASYLCYIRKCNSIFVRNFELHQVVKKIDLSSRVVSMQIAPGSAPYVYVIVEQGNIQMIDFVNESNTTEAMTLHERVRSLKVCPNGRYLITAGEKGDIAIWGVKRIKPQV